MAPPTTLIDCVYGKPTVVGGKAGVAMPSGGLIVIVSVWVNELPAELATAMTKLAVPGAVGLPLIVMVPLTGFVAMSEYFSPVVPPENELTENSVNGEELPTMDSVWL